jgi:acyl carrier protein
MSDEQVQEVFCDVLGLEPPVDWPAIRYGDVEAWDSLVHLALVAALETACDVALSDDDVLALGSYDDAVRIVRSAGAGG